MKSVAEFVVWLRGAPPGTTLSAESVLAVLEADAPPQFAASIAPVSSLISWRERLWTVPPETRLGVIELSEALGRAKSWTYRHTSRRSGLPRIPHRRLDGELVFVAGEVRAWIADHEDVVEPFRRPAVMSFKRGA